MNIKFFQLSTLLILCILIVIVGSTEGDSDRGMSTSKKVFNSENRCMYTQDGAERAPWTATLKVRRENNARSFDYYICTILDRYTVLTNGNGFETIADKLKIRPVGNYTVLLENERIMSQSLKVSIVQPYPDYDRRGGTGSRKDWMISENDYVILHLKDPIEFGPSVGPLCLPQLDPSPSAGNALEQLDALFIENTTTLMSGWRKDRIVMSLAITLASDRKCEDDWRNLTRAVVPKLQYQNRVCGYVSIPTNNPNSKCFPFDSGAVVRQDGRSTFMGFMNTYIRNPSKTEYCKEGAYFSIYKINPAILKWLNATLECGPNKYTCHNGQCAEFKSICNQNKSDGCSDGSDEDGKYCRALNQCRVDQFPCGVYGPCIPKFNNGKEAKHCDGVQDCPLNEDERECEKSPSIDGNYLILIVTSICVLFVIIITCAILVWRRLKQKQGWKLLEGDIDEFLLGTELEQNNTSSELETVCNGPFDAKTYEILLENIEKHEKIGDGTFGEVYRGEWKDGVRLVPCAIKTPRPDSDREQIKSFLRELKIMAYVGQHENITRFIGAHVQNLRNGKLYILVEYCEFGSLEEYITKHKGLFHNELVAAPVHSLVKLEDRDPSNYVHVDHIAACPVFSTTDLLTWASHIVNGMCHLTQKMVLHGDLAARNVLIDRHRVAKICDFGLAHHLLYANIKYITSLERRRRIPWKWMAVEVLLEMAMSTESDVWSFGVTLWEMFTLGSEPYEGQGWTQVFPYSLSTSGCPLQKPEFANDEIFDIMKCCWAIDPNNRPSFQELQSTFRRVEILPIST